MFHVNKLRILILTTLSVLVVTTVPSFAAEPNNTDPSNGSSISKPKDSGSSSSSSSASSAASGCFASDTLVTLANQKRIPIEQLRPGDELFSTDGFTVFITQMMMMLDKNRFSQTIFHTIITASGHSVSLTALHLIPIIRSDNTIKYIPAKQVKIGDGVYVMSDDQLVLSPVTNVILEMKTGYYAPLTTSGTMVANGIMTSCYSNVQSHEAAQFYMGPLRLYHWLAQSLSINESFGHQNMEGVHFVPQIMYKVVQFAYPSALRFS